MYENESGAHNVVSNHYKKMCHNHTNLPIPSSAEDELKVNACRFRGC